MPLHRANQPKAGCVFPDPKPRPLLHCLLSPTALLSGQMEDKTILAIDYGSRRIGLAKSDPTGLIASGLETLEVKSDNDAIKALTRVIETYQPTAIVIGYPLQDTGEKSRKCEEVDRFVEKLQRVYGGPIYRIDEGYTSREAISIVHAHGKKAGKNKKRIDQLAATLILQRYLDEQRAQ